MPTLVETIPEAMARIEAAMQSKDEKVQAEALVELIGFKLLLAVLAAGEMDKRRFN